MTNNFFEKIIKFNEMYGVESNNHPTNLGIDRINKFKDILQEELNEADALTADFKFEELADWLGDIIVYCASELRRWGLPSEQILDIIMESNFSKLGPDGKPIIDERGKVMKGPNYWKPEEQISIIISKKLSEGGL